MERLSKTGPVFEKEHAIASCIRPRLALSLAIQSEVCFANRHFAYRRRTVAILLAWMAIIGGLAWWSHADHANDLTEMARIYARACIDKNMIDHRWHETHSGLYATAPNNLQPDPYLQVAERDVNSAYLAQDVRDHTVSLKPRNPKYSPDEWERNALLTFEKGGKEASVVLCGDGQYTARLMRPLYVGQSCLKCHEEQGYKLGDVRGGISITVPVDSIWKAGTQEARSVFVVLGGIWMLGAVTIVLVGKFMNNRRLEREHAMEALA